MTPIPTHDARTPIVVSHEGALKFAAHIRSHRIVVDQPERSGGEDSGPSPLGRVMIESAAAVA